MKMVFGCSWEISFSLSSPFLQARLGWQTWKENFPHLPPHSPTPTLGRKKNDPRVTPYQDREIGVRTQAISNDNDHDNYDDCNSNNNIGAILEHLLYVKHLMFSVR